MCAAERCAEIFDQIEGHIGMCAAERCAERSDTRALKIKIY